MSEIPSVRLKVCGLTSEDNARKLIRDVGPDYLGFIFFPRSPRHVQLEKDGDWIRELQGPFKKTGVFVNEDPERIQEICRTCGLDAVQLHGEETPEVALRIREIRVTIIKVFSVGEDGLLPDLSGWKSIADYFLFDTKGKQPGGNGIQFPWEKALKNYPESKKYFLSGGIGPGDAATLKEVMPQLPGLYALDINSRFEKSPGIKDSQLIKEFVNTLK